MTMLETAEWATIRGGRRLSFESQVLDHEIELRFVRAGVAGDSDRGLPAVYVMDGTLQFGLAADAARMLAFSGEAKPHIIVAVGYPDSLPIEGHLTRRMLDLTPTRDEALESQPEVSADLVTGGASRFMQCLLTEVAPMIEAELPADPEQRVLCGHSLGGLFTLYAMLEQPDAFSAYIATSPSLWWDDRYMFRREQEYARDHDDLATRLFMSVGGLESTPSPDATDEQREAIERSRMVANMTEFAETLEGGYPSLELLGAPVFDDETHMSVMPAALTRGLRAVLAPPAG